MMVRIPVSPLNTHGMYSVINTYRCSSFFGGGQGGGFCHNKKPAASNGFNFK